MYVRNNDYHFNNSAKSSAVLNNKYKHTCVYKADIHWTDFNYEPSNHIVMCPSGSSSSRNPCHTNWFSTSQPRSVGIFTGNWRWPNISILPTHNCQLL